MSISGAGNTPTPPSNNLYISRQMADALKSDEAKKLVTDILGDDAVDGSDKANIQKLRTLLETAAKKDDYSIDGDEKSLLNALDSTGLLGTNKEVVKANLLALRSATEDANSVNFEDGVQIKTQDGITGVFGSKQERVLKIRSAAVQSEETTKAINNSVKELETNKSEAIKQLQGNVSQLSKDIKNTTPEAIKNEIKFLSDEKAKGNTNANIALLTELGISTEPGYDPTPEEVTRFRDKLASIANNYVSNPTPENYAQIRSNLYDSLYLFEGSSTPAAKNYYDFKQKLLDVNQVTDRVDQQIKDIKDGNFSSPGSVSTLNQTLDESRLSASANILNLTSKSQQLISQLKAQGSTVDTSKMEALTQSLINEGDPPTVKQPINQQTLDTLNQLWSEIESVGFKSGLSKDEGEISATSLPKVASDPQQQAMLEIIKKKPELAKHTALLEKLSQPANKPLLEAVLNNPSQVASLLNDYNYRDFSTFFSPWSLGLSSNIGLTGGIASDASSNLFSPATSGITSQFMIGDDNHSDLNSTFQFKPISTQTSILNFDESLPKINTSSSGLGIDLDIPGLNLPFAQTTPRWSTFSALGGNSSYLTPGANLQLTGVNQADIQALANIFADPEVRQALAPQGSTEGEAITLPKSTASDIQSYLQTSPDLANTRQALETKTTFNALFWDGNSVLEDAQRSLSNHMLTQESSLNEFKLASDVISQQLKDKNIPPSVKAQLSAQKEALELAITTVENGGPLTSSPALEQALRSLSNVNNSNQDLSGRILEEARMGALFSSIEDGSIQQLINKLPPEQQESFRKLLEKDPSGKSFFTNSMQDLLSSDSLEMRHRNDIRNNLQMLAELNEMAKSGASAEDISRFGNTVGAGKAAGDSPFNLVQDLTHISDYTQNVRSVAFDLGHDVNQFINAAEHIKETNIANGGQAPSRAALYQQVNSQTSHFVDVRKQEAQKRVSQYESNMELQRDQAKLVLDNPMVRQELSRIQINGHPLSNLHNNLDELKPEALESAIRQLDLRIRELSMNSGSSAANADLITALTGLKTMAQGFKDYRQAQIFLTSDIDRSTSRIGTQQNTNRSILQGAGILGTVTTAIQSGGSVINNPSVQAQLAEIERTQGVQKRNEVEAAINNYAMNIVGIGQMGAVRENVVNSEEIPETRSRGVIRFQANSNVMDYLTTKINDPHTTQEDARRYLDMQASYQAFTAANPHLRGQALIAATVAWAKTNLGDDFANNLNTTLTTTLTTHQSYNGNQQEYRRFGGGTPGAQGRSQGAPVEDDTPSSPPGGALGIQGVPSDIAFDPKVDLAPADDVAALYNESTEALGGPGIANERAFESTTIDNVTVNDPASSMTYAYEQGGLERLREITRPLQENYQNNVQAYEDLNTAFQQFNIRADASLSMIESGQSQIASVAPRLASHSSTDTAAASKAAVAEADSIAARVDLAPRPTKSGNELTSKLFSDFLATIQKLGADTRKLILARMAVQMLDRVIGERYKALADEANKYHKAALDKMIENLRDKIDQSITQAEMARGGNSQQLASMIGEQGAPGISDEQLRSDFEGIIDEAMKMNPPLMTEDQKREIINALFDGDPSNDQLGLLGIVNSYENQRAQLSAVSLN